MPRSRCEYVSRAVYNALHINEMVNKPELLFTIVSSYLNTYKCGYSGNNIQKCDKICVRCKNEATYKIFFNAKSKNVCDKDMSDVKGIREMANINFTFG